MDQGQDLSGYLNLVNWESDLERFYHRGAPLLISLLVFILFFYIFIGIRVSSSPFDVLIATRIHKGGKKTHTHTGENLLS